MLAKGGIPQDVNDAKIITLYKNKRERIDCDIDRGVFILSIVDTIFAHEILGRLQQLSERV